MTRTVRIAANVNEWVQLATRNNLHNTSLFDPSLDDKVKLSSASNIGEAQYQLLRCVWPVSKNWDKLEPFLTNKQALKMASEILAKWDSFNQYLDQLQLETTQPSAKRHPHADIGCFSLTRYYQLLVERNTSTDEGEPHFGHKTPGLDFGKPDPINPSTPTENFSDSGSADSSPTRGRGKGPSKNLSMTYALDVDEPNQASVSVPVTPENTTSSSSAHIQAKTRGFPHSIFKHASPLSPMTEDEANYLQASEDEQIVNTALVLLLNSLTIYHSKISGDWSLYRHPFKITTSSTTTTKSKVAQKAMKLFEARVDGVLRIGNRVHAIMEVKPGGRSTTSTTIEAQESAQMAAWIHADPPEKQCLDRHRKNKTRMRRWLISQDRNAIYVTAGDFDALYVDYIRNNAPFGAPLGGQGLAGFLTMRLFGPFDTSKAAHMNPLAHVILYITLTGRDTDAN